VSTSYSTVVSLSVTAGTWLLIARGVTSYSATQQIKVDARIYNSTDTTALDTITIGSDYVSGTDVQQIPAVCIVNATFASTKTVIFQAQKNAVGDTINMNTGFFIAVPIGV